MGQYVMVVLVAGVCAQGVLWFWLGASVTVS